MHLPSVVNTFGHAMQRRYGFKVHKLAIDAGFTCPNRDGSKGRGGCTFCNNRSFAPSANQQIPIAEQIRTGARIIQGLNGAQRYLAYFQAYTNTYERVETLRELYDEALGMPGVMGLSVGTRPDCVPDAVLDLLCEYRDRGLEVWLELGLQSTFDATLLHVNRGHGFAEYRDAVQRAHLRGLQVCTHLIAGLPGEGERHSLASLGQVLDLGVEGLKIHPLHVVRGTRLARDWKQGDYRPLSLEAYAALAAEMVSMTPGDVIFHRLTGTAPASLLLAPAWCAGKWAVLNHIARLLAGAQRQPALAAGL